MPAWFQDRSVQCAALHYFRDGCHTRTLSEVDLNVSGEGKSPTPQSHTHTVGRTEGSTSDHSFRLEEVA